MVNFSVSLSTYACCEFTKIFGCDLSYYPTQTGLLTALGHTTNLINVAAATYSYLISSSI